MINKRNTRFFCGLAAALGLVVLALFFGTPGKVAAAADAKATPTPDPTRRLSSITAVYTGKTEIVGHSIDLEKIRVMGLYTDGSYEIIEDYSLSQNTLTKAGINEITVTYGSASTKISIKAKQLSFLSANFKGGDKTVGDVLEKEDIAVYAYYSDGSNEAIKDYILSNDRVAAVGANTFYVYYEDQKASFTVTGKPIRLIKELRAYYTGGTKMVGEALERGEFSVTAIYNDNLMEEINDYEIVPKVVQTEGTNTIFITKGGVVAEVTVYGRAREIVSIEAKYKGKPVAIGNEVKKEDFEVMAVYEGNSVEKEEVKDFTLTNTYIYKLGDNNEVFVFFAGKQVTVKVRGIETEVVDYSNSAEQSIKDGNKTVNVTVALNAKADKSKLRIEAISPQLVKKAMRKLDAEQYMVMGISFDDPELSVYLPMTVKVTIPAGYSKDNFGVFYSTNRKTVVAKMNGELLWDGSYEFKIFQPGTYILANCTEKGKE